MGKPLLVFTVLLASCGAAPEPVPAEPYRPTLAGIMNGSPDITDAQLAGIARRFAHHHPWIDLSQVTLVIEATRDDALVLCRREYACASPQREAIAAFDVNPNGLAPNDHWAWWGAFEVAHALCHARYLQGGGDGDPTHQRAECFADAATATADDFVRGVGR